MQSDKARQSVHLFYPFFKHFQGFEIQLHKHCCRYLSYSPQFLELTHSLSTTHTIITITLKLATTFYHYPSATTLPLCAPWCMAKRVQNVFIGLDQLDWHFCVWGELFCNCLWVAEAFETSHIAEHLDKFTAFHIVRMYTKHHHIKSCSKFYQYYQSIHYSWKTVQLLKCALKCSPRPSHSWNVGGFCDTMAFHYTVPNSNKIVHI